MSASIPGNLISANPRRSRALSASGPRLQALCLLQATLVAAIWFMRLTYSGREVDGDALVGPLCLTVVALSLWALWTWRQVQPGILDAYGFLLVATIAFNGGQAFLELVGLNNVGEGMLRSQFSRDIVAQTLFAVALGLASLHWGALCAAAVNGCPSRRPEMLAQEEDESQRRAVRWVGCGLLLLALPFTSLLLRQAIVVVLSHGYLALYQQEVHTGIGAIPQILGTLLIPGVFFLLAGSRESQLSRRLAVGIGVTYAVTHLFLGYRYYACMPLVAMAWLWHRQIRRLHLVWLGGALLLLLLVVFPLIRVSRVASGSDRLSTRVLIDYYYSIDNPAVAILYEMGGSAETVAHTITLVPEHHPYELGASYFYALLTVVPNFFGGLHPSIARGTPSSWLIWEVDPFTASQGGGLGYSVIAEGYLNLGWWGLPIALGLLGFGLGAAAMWVERSPSPARMAAAACVINFLTFYARADAATVVRGVVWYALIPYAMSLVACRCLSRRNAGRETATPK